MNVNLKDNPYIYDFIKFKLNAQIDLRKEIFSGYPLIFTLITGILGGNFYILINNFNGISKDHIFFAALGLVITIIFHMLIVGISKIKNREKRIRTEFMFGFTIVICLIFYFLNFTKEIDSNFMNIKFVSSMISTVPIYFVILSLIFVSKSFLEFSSTHLFSVDDFLSYINNYNKILLERGRLDGFIEPEQHYYIELGIIADEIAKNNQDRLILTHKCRQYIVISGLFLLLFGLSIILVKPFL